MARRRFQAPTPQVVGNWWYIRPWVDKFQDGKLARVRQRVRLGAASMKAREVLKLADQYMHQINQGLVTAGGAMSFQAFVDVQYRPGYLPLLAKSTQGRTEGVIRNYLLPAFGRLSLKDITYQVLQRYFSAMATSQLQAESRDKIRDVLASILGEALKCHYLVTNPITAVRLPRAARGVAPKRFVTPQQFGLLVELMAEPYATMVYVAVWTGLRVSELVGLKWDDVQDDALTIDERFCRGEWGAPKSLASNVTVPVRPEVIARIQRLRSLEVSVRAGTGTRKYKVVKKDGPQDLVFQSVQDGTTMRDNNILSRHLKPAARKLGLDFVNWRCLRVSFAMFLKSIGADIKDAQGLMRHSRASTTTDIYMQLVPESMKRAVANLKTLTDKVQ